MLTAGVATVLAAILLVAGSTLADAAGWGPAFRVLRWPVTLALVVTALALLFEVAPRRRQPEASWLAVGSGLAAVLWLAFTGRLAVFVGASPSFGATYGPLAGTMAVLLWTFLSAVALLLGLAFAAQLEAVRAGVTATRVDRDAELSARRACDTRALMPIQDATSLRRGLAIVEVLAEHAAAGGEPLGVVRIAELVGREKSQVSRTLQHARGDRVRRARPGHARLPDRLAGVRARRPRRASPRLLALAQPVMRGLVAELGETAHLSVLDGAEVLTLLSEAPPSAIRATGYSGRVVAVASTSSGRALLFDHDRAEFDALLAVTGLARLGPNAPRTAAELWRRLERARELGYAVAEEESEVDLVAVAAPVRDFRGRRDRGAQRLGPAASGSAPRLDTRRRRRRGGGRRALRGARQPPRPSQTLCVLRYCSLMRASVPQ